MPEGTAPLWPSARRAAIWASYCAGVTTLTLKSICEWSTPQSSVHLPLKVPSWVGVTWNLFTTPGMTSIFMRKSTGQKPWITSREVSSNSTD